MQVFLKRAGAGIAVAMLGLSLSACGDTPTNASLYSVKQPVVERHTLAMDLREGYGGLSMPEQQRLGEWFNALELGYGDRIAIAGSGTARETKESIGAVAARYGLLLSDVPPAVAEPLAPGTVRVVVSRSRAYVPGCPDWSDRIASFLENATDDNYGCAVNSNLAAMVADPEDLIRGNSDDSVIAAGLTANKSVDAYRNRQLTGGEGLSEESAGEN
ncbi:CpaD family pilus assembly protein [Altericroceibacterium endophyticum]|uniref:Pilus assembly protein CpaD n=1 Tax=Altericroceibacterium endophyticum TaxID=1808508 RepID=A0A6I4T770_9SPHN|nr:CpaD family pilus assembly protein [Altericroceibacterium endophyticum]MXO66508.1 pilus assembly protein CpaD [Altericroceibacterium endophyticum]